MTNVRWVLMNDFSIGCDTNIYYSYRVFFFLYFIWFYFKWIGIVLCIGIIIVQCRWCATACVSCVWVELREFSNAHIRWSWMRVHCAVDIGLNRPNRYIRCPYTSRSAAIPKDRSHREWVTITNYILYTYIVVFRLWFDPQTSSASYSRFYFILYSNIYNINYWMAIGIDDKLGSFSDSIVCELIWWWWKYHMNFFDGYLREEEPLALVFWPGCT